MALNVQFVKSNNALINEGMVTARLVNQHWLQRISAFTIEDDEESSMMTTVGLL